MNQPPKQRIRQSFERAAPTYDSAAQIQRHICGQLADGLSETAVPKRVLDVGCGTGYALRLLHDRFPSADVIGLDLSPAMLGRTKPSFQRLAADAERLPLADATIDLYWSSLALQWCDLATALAEAQRVLQARGHLAIATLGPETFFEMRTAFAAADAYRHTLAFLTPEQISLLLDQAGFPERDIRRESVVGHYADLKSLLGAVKAIGANQVGPGRRTGLMSRAAWQRAESAYESLRQPAGLPLTYDVITIHARK